MGSGTPRPPHRRGRTLVLLTVGACLLLPRTAAPQGLTGTLIGIVRDAQGDVVAQAPPVSVPPRSSAGR